eukprot:1155620-Pelagomonas_calceolata.AAC.13
MATTTTTRRIASRAILSDPDGAPDGRASAANPLGPMGDVLMETVPLQNTDKKASASPRGKGSPFVRLCVCVFASIQAFLQIAIMG